jgi:hypothetical protein
LFEGAEILWVDDRPSNNRNEARMLRSFGALITFAATTKGDLCPERGKRPVQRRPQSPRLYTWFRQHLRRRDHARCF